MDLSMLDSILDQEIENLINSSEKIIEKAKSKDSSIEQVLKVQESLFIVVLYMIQEGKEEKLIEKALNLIKALQEVSSSKLNMNWEE
ncbi:hypothetical protein SNUCP4_31240 [Clostridium perfringens A]|uniref:hypothetical protein n=1 Tax=Clostridium perfringens TaxID=1502 RepID=UPI00399CFA09